MSNFDRFFNFKCLAAKCENGEYVLSLDCLSIKQLELIGSKTALIKALRSFNFKVRTINKTIYAMES